MSHSGLIALALGGCISGTRAHDADAQALREAMVGRDIDRVRLAARRLHRRLPTLHDGLRPVVDAPDTTVAGEAIGRVLPRCAACHEERRVPAPVLGAAATPERATVQAAMQAHASGAEEMWHGLLFSDLARVKRGASRVAASNLVPTGTPVGSPVSPLATEQEVHVQDLADRAAQASDLAVASAAYGRMLSRCASCHAVTDGGPER